MQLFLLEVRQLIRVDLLLLESRLERGNHVRRGRILLFESFDLHLSNF